MGIEESDGEGEEEEDEDESLPDEYEEDQQIILPGPSSGAEESREYDEARKINEVM